MRPGASPLPGRAAPPPPAAVPSPPALPAPLLARVKALVGQACRVYAGGPAMPALDAAAARLEEPLRVAIAGRIKAGKSTLLNALVGQELAATDAGECTRVVTWFRDGPGYRVVAHPRHGPPRPLPPGPTGALFDSDLGGLRAQDVDRVTVDWPSAALKSMTLIDTPGMDSLSTELSRRASQALDERGDGPGVADAVVYLMRHVHASDIRFLEAFRDDPAEHRPINTLGVLGRADEVGHGRPDALDSAARVAARYRDDPAVSALCQTVLPVAGLLAATAATLREDEFRAVEVLAEAPEEEVERLLLTADRFAGHDAGTIELSPARRAALLERFGLFGLRLSVRLRYTGLAGTSGALSRELLTRSGLQPLRDALVSRFAGRADVLRSRSALLAVEGVLRRHPVPAAARLRHELEVVTSSAHEFAEVRLLDALRTGVLLLTETERASAELLLGGAGAAAHDRLALDPAAPVAEVGAAARSALVQWQRRAEHPASARDVREASRVLVRTCEGLVVGTLGPRGTHEQRPPGGR